MDYPPFNIPLKIKTMTSEQILRADMLDILFEHRNKSYGAYTLRRHYNSRLSFSLIFSISSFIIVLLILQPGEVFKSSLPTKAHRELKLTQVDLPHVLPEIPRTPSPPPQPQNTATANFNNIQLVQHVEPESQLLTIREIEYRAISNTNSENISNRFMQSLTPAVGSLAPISNSINESEPVQFIKAEIQPQFPGGLEAWKKFLAENLVVPFEMFPGEVKTVIVKFLVDIDGSVTGFNIEKSGGTAFDREVLRVLKKMPKWKPAVQNGLAVPVTFTQPVSFVGIEQ